MGNITDLKVGQIRIFPVDIVPLKMIASKSFHERLKEDFSISEIEVLPLLEGINSVIYRRGEIIIRGKITIINKIEIDPRRIIIDIAGTSKHANQVYNKLLSSISSLTNDIDIDSLRTPLLLAETTQCIATLDFNINALYNNSLVRFINKTLKKATTNVTAESSVKLVGIACEINYNIIDEALSQNKITMNPKQFTIIPRPGLPLESKKYLISSPLDSDTHLKLIKELNAVISE